MASKRLHQEEEPWLRYPEPHTTTDSKFSFQKQPTFGGYLTNSNQHLDTSSTNTKRPLSTEFDASSFHLRDFGFNHTNINNSNINNIRTHAFSPSGPSPASASFASSSSSPTGPQPRTLSEELAMALQQQPPENNFNDCYPSPTTPSGLLSSPADLSMPSSSSSSFSSLSSSHFPLFKPRLYDTSSSSSAGQQDPRHNPNNINYNYRSNPEDAPQPRRKPRPSPLALYANPTNLPTSHHRATGSPTSAISRDTTTAHDIVGSPQTAMSTATASAVSFGYMGTSRSQLHHQRQSQRQSQHRQYAGATSPLSHFHHLSNSNNNNHGSNHGSHGNHRYSLQGPPPSNSSQSLMHPHHRASSLSVSSGTSTSSYSTISSPASSSPCLCAKGIGHRPGCHKSSSTQTHHPACQHHTHFASTPISSTTATAATNTSPQPPQQTSFQLQPSQQQQQQAQYAAKFGRATKGVSRFGTPHFTPEFDPSDPSYTPSFSRSNRRLASGVSGENNGYGRPRDYDDDAMDVDDASYASEPPKKKQRSTASILLGAAVETVIFTGAVALSAYQLLTGKGKLSTDSSANHSKQGSTASDVVNDAPASEGAMQEDEKSVVSMIGILLF